MSGPLLDWYAEQGRSLPWRSSRDPWVILVTEVMSQQTRIERVVARIDGFMERFPTPAAMAGSTITEVLAEWSGLGYNRRAIRLREAAVEIVATGWPRSAGALRELPGIGRYTAAAVACFAFGEQVPAVDTNLRRVLSRWEGHVLSDRELEETATRLLPPGRAADWNQAIMDLGALVCTPVPDCVRCPVVAGCSDPDVYLAPLRQSPFAGSPRQARGAVLRALLDDRADATALVESTGLAEERVVGALAVLHAEGTIVTTGEGLWAVAGAD